MIFLRAVLYLAIVGGLAFAAVWLAERPGSLVLTWLGYRLELSIGFALAALALVVLALLLAWRILFFLLRAPGRIRASRSQARLRKGYLALTKGFAAAAAGEVDEAKRLGRMAMASLQGAPIAHLLAAQAAQLDGDGAAATRHYAALTQAPETAALGLRGLAGQALKRDKDETALSLAAQALAAHPQAQWAADLVHRLNAKLGRLDEALAALPALVGSGAMTPKGGQRRRAVILAEKARRDLGPDAATPLSPAALEAAMKAAREALKLAGDLVPARLLLARLLLRQGKAREAQRLIEQVWDDAPHPLLAKLFAAAAENETPLERVRRLQRLERANPDHAETHRALAEGSLAAGLYGEARRHLDRLGAIESEAGGIAAGTARLKALLPRDGQDDGDDAPRWLDLASRARPDPAWHCAQCGAPSPAGPEAGHWQLLCPRCGAIDGFRWQSPPRSGLAEPPLETAFRLAGESGRRSLAPPEALSPSVDAARLIN